MSRTLTLLLVAACAVAPVAVAAYVSPAQQANRVLKLPQRTPCNINLFARGVYPKGSRMKAATGTPLSEAQVRRQLEPYLLEQFGTSQAQTRTVLSVFDRYETKRRVPQPSLRAAFVSLAGTLSEPALNYFLRNESVLTTIDYGTLPAKAAVAQSVPDGSRRRIVVDSRFQYEHFGLLSVVLAREILHHDGVMSPAEEAIAGAVTALTYMQLLQRHPPLATRGTELSRLLNTSVLAWTNSRAAGSPRSAIIAPSGRGLYPGSPLRRPDLWALFAARTSAESPAPPVLADVLRGIVAPGVAIPQSPTFSRRTALLFGKLNDRWLSELDRVRVSALLGLVSVQEITKATKLERAEAVRTFGLGSIRAGCR